MKKGRKPGEFLIQKAKHKRRAEIQDAINKMRAEGESIVDLKWLDEKGKRWVNTYKLTKIPDDYDIQPYHNVYLCKIFNKYLDVGVIACKDVSDWKLIGLKSGSLDYHLKLKDILCFAQILHTREDVLIGRPL